VTTTTIPSSSSSRLSTRHRRRRHRRRQHAWAVIVVEETPTTPTATTARAAARAAAAREGGGGGGGATNPQLHEERGEDDSEGVFLRDAQSGNDDDDDNGDGNDDNGNGNGGGNGNGNGNDGLSPRLSNLLRDLHNSGGGGELDTRAARGGSRFCAVGNAACALVCKVVAVSAQTRLEDPARALNWWIRGADEGANHEYEGLGCEDNDGSTISSSSHPTRGVVVCTRWLPPVCPVPPLTISGVTGPDASKVNGTYFPVEGEQYNGRCLLRKVEDPDRWLRYATADGTNAWMVSKTADMRTNQKTGLFMSAETGLQSPLDAVSWSLWDGRAWQCQTTCNVAPANNYDGALF